MAITIEDFKLGQIKELVSNKTPQPISEFEEVSSQQWVDGD